MRNCYKCCHTIVFEGIKNDGDTTIIAPYFERRIQPFLFHNFIGRLSRILSKIISYQLVGFPKSHHLPNTEKSFPIFKSKTSLSFSVKVPFEPNNNTVIQRYTFSSESNVYPTKVFWFYDRF